MTTVYIRRVGVAAPGLPNWESAIPVLAGQSAWVSEEMPKYAPGVLPPNERRRATRIARLAFQAAEDAVGGADATGLEDIAAVFASSGGDSEVLNKICMMLSMPERPVSPTYFHNSVHNAPAGYWSIATGSRLPSTALSAHDGSFNAGLMEAASLAATEKHDVLLVAYDLALPLPLREKRPIDQDFAAALVITPNAASAIGKIELTLLNGAAGEPSVMPDSGLETLRLCNPAARALPLLAALAAKQTTQLIIPGVPGERLSLEVSPC